MRTRVGWVGGGLGDEEAAKVEGKQEETPEEYVWVVGRLGGWAVGQLCRRVLVSLGGVQGCGLQAVDDTPRETTSSP